MNEARIAELFTEAKDLLKIFGLDVMTNGHDPTDEYQYEVCTNTCTRRFRTAAELWSFAYGVSEGAGIERQKSREPRE